MKMIVGLGNPGAKYRETKHNIGFITVDELAYRHQSRFDKTQCQGELCRFLLGGEQVMLVKPQTFMNLSGQAVGALLDYYDLTADDLLVIYDDLDLPVGRIRLREKGSAGGHNGMKSIIAHLGTQAFKRIKVGIDRPKAGQEVVNHVLSPFSKDVHEDVLGSVMRAADAAEYWASGHSFTETMNQFNGG